MGTWKANLPPLIEKVVDNEVDAGTIGKKGDSPGQDGSDQIGPVIGTEEDELAAWLRGGRWLGEGMLLVNKWPISPRSQFPRKKEGSTENDGEGGALRASGTDYLTCRPSAK